jgi:hypothetical protein
LCVASGGLICAGIVPIHPIVAPCYRETLDEGQISLSAYSGTYHGTNDGVPVADRKIG